MMWGLLFRRITLIFLAFYLFVAICASSKRGKDHGMRPYHRHHRNPKHQSSKAHSHKYSPSITPARQYFFLNRRDFVPKLYISSKKRNTVDKHYGNQVFPQMDNEEKNTSTMEYNIKFGKTSICCSNRKSNSDKTGKINPNDLGYGDLKRVEDADQSVNEVINTIIDGDKDLVKAISDGTGYRGRSEDFDVTIDKYARKRLHVPAKSAPEVVSGGLQEETQVGGSDHTLHNGKTNEADLAHSWSVRLDSSDRVDCNQNGSKGNISNSNGSEGDTNSTIEGADGSITSHRIGNTSTSIGGTAKEDNAWNVYREVGDKVDGPFKQIVDSGPILSGGENREIKNGNTSIIADDISSTKMLNLSHKTTSYISKNNSLMEDTNLANHDDEVKKNGRNQNFSNKIQLQGDGNGSLCSKGEANVEIIDDWPNKNTQNGGSNNSSISIESGNTGNTPEQYGKDSNNFVDDKQFENAHADTPSGYLRQHPNAFRVLMEYFRKESLLQQKLRERLTALRKTSMDENAIKKSFASVHEVKTLPAPPLPLRDFVANLFKFATEHVSPEQKFQNILKTKASKQRFDRDKEKLTSPENAGISHRKPTVVAPRKIVGRPHNSVQATKQSLRSRKTDVTFLADFENVTEVANEINGNITKIFQDAMNSKSEDAMSSEASASSILGLAEDRIGKIISQNEISQNVVENAESDASSTASFGNNNTTSKAVRNTAISAEAKGPVGSNTIKVEVIGPVESYVKPNMASRLLVNHSKAISKSEKEFVESNSVSNEASYTTTQTSPSEALYDFIHIKNDYMNSKTMMLKKGLKSLEVSLSQDFFNFWMYHYRSFEEMSIKPEQLRSGIATVGSTDRLERVIKKALKGETVNILIVGGSISAGGGLERDRHDLHGIYYKAFVEWWKNTVTPITMSDLKLNVVAIGGTDSEYFSYCIKNYIQDKPDLVIWELAANDYRRYAGRKMDPSKPLEQLTRLLLTLPSQPALIFINFFRGDYYKTTLERDCPDSEDEGGKRMAEYYKITSLSWRNIICSQIKTDMRPSKGEKREFTPLTLKTLFSSDGYHPSLLGHAQCAALLISYIRSVFEEVVSREISRIDNGKAEDDNIPNKSNLPQPIYSNAVTPNPMCWTLLTSNFHRQIQNQLPGMRILEANGFEFTNITRWPVRMDRLRCLKALHSDASLRIKFDVLRKENNKSSTRPTNVAVISHNSFLGSARVWLDNDQYNAVNIEEPAGQRRTQANIIKRFLQPGSHVITIRSITPGFCVSALAIL